MAKGTVNKVTLIGRLGQDPEIRFTGDGAAVASFSVATNESWKSKDGETQERTEWTKVTVFGSTAEKYVQPYVKKRNLGLYRGIFEDRQVARQRRKRKIFNRRCC